MQLELSTPAVRASFAKFDILRDNAWAVLVVIVYAYAVSLVAVYVGHPENIPSSTFVLQWMLLPGAWAACRLAQHAWQQSRGSGIKDEARRQRQFARDQQIFSGLVVMVALRYFLGCFNNMKSMLSMLRPFAWDGFFTELDARIHGTDPSLLLPHNEAFIRFVQWLYLPGWLITLIIFTFCVCLYADPFTRKRYLKTFFFAWIGLGNVMAVMFMSAGPIFLERLNGARHFQAISRYLEFSRGLKFSSVNLADNLWHLQQSNQASVGSGISAFPSLHIAMVTLWTLTAWDKLPRARYLFLAFALLILAGSVVLGWHYAVDGYFSIAATLGAWWLFGRDKRRVATAG